MTHVVPTVVLGNIVIFRNVTSCTRSPGQHDAGVKWAKEKYQVRQNGNNNNSGNPAEWRLAVANCYEMSTPKLALLFGSWFVEPVLSNDCRVIFPDFTARFSWDFFYDKYIFRKWHNIINNTFILSYVSGHYVGALQSRIIYIIYKYRTHVFYTHDADVG